MTAESPAQDPSRPLWRAAGAFRAATVAYAVATQISSDDQHTRPALSWTLIAVLVVWSAVAALALTSGRWRTQVVIGDHVVAIALMYASRLVSDEAFWSSHQPLPTTLWVTNAALSTAVLLGPWAGVASGLLLGLLSLDATNDLNRVLIDSTVPVLVTAGLTMGVASAAARRANAQLAEAIRIRAATDERERLAREVHDGVLQVLALMRRRGAGASGELGELAALAGEQEQALRVLLSEQSAPVTGDGGSVDLRRRLRTVVPPGVDLAAPASAVVVPRRVAEGLEGAVRTALANVERHAGPQARAFVLVEELDDAVVVTVRDDGVGIEPGRLRAAETAGRMGVSKSIRGRVEELGGEAVLETAPGEGTEWELRVPLARR
ncbi:MacS family sensor histidine kinase [Luteipulveratus flavus]|uniref:DUF5931 domain-containing protein n=1 Tax=Luteipulveratus flavus TaxID=3031728 RepID=A0ABT6C9X3_9MICO|nr:DUF5931 domain-containing protein [Luteipulveratus sp. YIM 133296]MDF8265673.1 DUF5931 domain-containing protein [Luteipulveratus sp. YIM 133296]